MNKIKNIMFVFLFIAIVGCTPTTPISPAVQKPNVPFSIISSNKDSNGKCIISVQLKDLLIKSDVVQVASYIKSNSGDGCSKIWVYFFLPGDKPGVDGAWAYVSYTPDLEVKINGMTVEGKATLQADLQKQPDQAQDKNVVGSWLCSYGFSYSAVLKKENGAYNLTTKYSDGSGETKPLYANTIKGEERLFEKPNVSTGTYITIMLSGNLAYFDKQGLIYECSKGK